MACAAPTAAPAEVSPWLPPLAAPNPQQLPALAPEPSQLDQQQADNSYSCASKGQQPPQHSWEAALLDSQPAAPLPALTDPVAAPVDPPATLLDVQYSRLIPDSLADRYPPLQPDRTGIAVESVSQEPPELPSPVFKAHPQLRQLVRALLNAKLADRRVLLSNLRDDCVPFKTVEAMDKWLMPEGQVWRAHVPATYEPLCCSCMHCWRPQHSFAQATAVTRVDERYNTLDLWPQPQQPQAHHTGAAATAHAACAVCCDQASVAADAPSIRESRGLAIDLWNKNCDDDCLGPLHLCMNPNVWVVCGRCGLVIPYIIPKNLDRTLRSGWQTL